MRKHSLHVQALSEKQYFHNLDLSNQALLEFNDVEEVLQMLNASMFYVRA